MFICIVPNCKMIDFLSSEHIFKRSFVKTVYKGETQFYILHSIASRFISE